VILGHLTVTAAGHHLLRRRWPALPVPLGALLVGAYLPDLLDKPMALLTGLSGRGYGHSILVQVVLFAVAGTLFRRQLRLVATLALGCLIHLLQDWVTLEVLLAPMLGPIPQVEMQPLLVKLIVFYTSGSLQMWIEVAAVLYWIGVGALAVAGRSARRARRRASQTMASSRAL
jgi:membrane-bound metal-dependent hydrolase YbcI (DUF457 family)